MLLARDFRQEAWNKLKGKWGTMVLAYLIYGLIIGACSFIPAVGSIASLVLTGPLTLGFVMLTVAVIRGGAVEFKTLFSGFSSFAKSFVLYLTNAILTALWSLLFVIPGIVKSYSYSMSYYIMLDNPELSANEARKASMRMMNGNKWRLFCLDLSFIGWILLSMLTFGILLFWVVPYVQTAHAAFYESLREKPVENQQPAETPAVEA